MLYVTCYFLLPLLFNGVEGLVGENVDGAEKEDEEEKDVLPLSDGKHIRITSSMEFNTLFFYILFLFLLLRMDAGKNRKKKKPFSKKIGKSAFVASSFWMLKMLSKVNLFSITEVIR